jgi:hypothetical protein
MHDLDRTVFETGSAEFEGEYEGEQALESLFETEYEHEYESGELHEAQELELASELLEVSNEYELEQFLGNLMSTAAGAARSFINSPTGRQLGGVLRQAAKKALPIVGRAAGEWVRPGGGKAGARLASAAGCLFGLELEGLSHEDREFEVARGYVRFAADATRRAVSSPAGAPPPQVVASAVTGAARRHAPGLVGRPGRRRSGRWERRGSSIVIHGV